MDGEVAGRISVRRVLLLYVKYSTNACDDVLSGWLTPFAAQILSASGCLAQGGARVFHQRGIRGALET